MKRISILLGVILLICACSRKPSYPEAPFDGNSIRLELTGIPDKKPVFFTFSAAAQGINYFLLKTDGHIESYFDACGKCYPRKFGFRQEKGRIVCKICEVSYHLEDLKDGIGSCYPIKLNGRVEGNIFVIDKQDILNGKKYF